MFVLDPIATGWWSVVADAVLVVHVGVPVFLVVGQVAIIMGAIWGVHWVRNARFRVAHLGLIAFIAGQTWLGRVCPLTLLEQAFRRRAAQAPDQITSTQHWLDPFLFCDAPTWVFTTLHSLAALVIIATWIAIPPAWNGAPIPSQRDPDALEI